MVQRTIAIVAGGTAGHVFPAQAISEILGTKNNILFFTDSRGRKFCDEKEKQNMVLPVRNIQGSIFKKVISLLYLGLATLKSLYILKRQKPAVVIGFGGITSFPVLFAAKLLKIPIILHEQNSVIGKANKFFLKDSKFLATSFENTIGVDSNNKIIYTGNPIRQVIFDSKRRRTKITAEIFIVVIGGSQGSTIFDTTIANAVTGLPRDLQEKITLFQQVREENNDSVNSLYEFSSIKKYTLQSFFKEIPQLMADADLIISRAGASAISEIEHLRIPSIIIPITNSVGNHQICNAQSFELQGTSKIILEKDFSAEALRVKLEDLFIRNEIDISNSKIKHTNINNAAQKLAIKVNEVIIGSRL